MSDSEESYKLCYTERLANKAYKILRSVQNDKVPQLSS